MTMGPILVPIVESVSGVPDLDLARLLRPRSGPPGNLLASARPTFTWRKRLRPTFPLYLQKLDVHKGVAGAGRPPSLLA